MSLAVVELYLPLTFFSFGHAFQLIMVYKRFGRSSRTFQVPPNVLCSSRSQKYSDLGKKYRSKSRGASSSSPCSFRPHTWIRHHYYSAKEYPHGDPVSVVASKQASSRASNNPMTVYAPLLQCDQLIVTAIVVKSRENLEYVW